MVIHRPKACEMVGFGSNWDREDIVEAEEESKVTLNDDRKQGDGSGAKTKLGGNADEEDEVEPHPWSDEGSRGVEVEEGVTDSLERVEVGGRAAVEEIARDERIGVNEGGEEPGEEDEKQQRHNINAAAEKRWILGTNSEIRDGMPEEGQQPGKEGFRQALARNIIAVATQRKGDRVRTPAKFFDEVQTVGTTNNGVARGDRPKKIGGNKRYGSINVRTLAMKDDRNRKETCGQTAAAVEWVIEFEERGLGVVGLQECRIPSGMDGCEGEYRTYYSGSVDGKRQHGVGIYKRRIRHTTRQRPTDVGIRDDLRCKTSSSRSICADE